MKYSHLTYYLLAILCMMATSCVSDGVMGDCPIDNNDQAVLIEGGKVNFRINFPDFFHTRHKWLIRRFSKRTNN